MAKGGDFEREVARELSLWFTQKERDDIFYRSHGSGGRFSARYKTGKDTALQGGDITCSDPIGEPLIKAWNIECKTGYSRKRKKVDTSKKITRRKTEITNWCLLDMIDSHIAIPNFKGFWEQCCDDAFKTRRNPVLVFRRPFKVSCVTISRNHYLDIVNWNGSPLEKYSIIQAVFHNIEGSEAVVIMRFTDFLDWVNPEFYKKKGIRRR